MHHLPASGSEGLGFRVSSIKPKGSMYLNFKAKGYTIWVHGPLGKRNAVANKGFDDGYLGCASFHATQHSHIRGVGGLNAHNKDLIRPI